MVQVIVQVPISLSFILGTVVFGPTSMSIRYFGPAGKNSAAQRCLEIHGVSALGPKRGATEELPGESGHVAVSLN